MIKKVFNFIKSIWDYILWDHKVLGSGYGMSILEVIISVLVICFFGFVKLYQVLTG
jgi:hypothetical protein